MGLRGTLGRLLQVLDAAPPFALADVVLRELGESVGAISCVILLADYEARVLEPVPPSSDLPFMGSQEVGGSVAGRCYRDQRPQIDLDLRRCFVPITQREERIGVLDVSVGGELDASIRDHLEQVAALLAHEITGARRYTDYFERIRRRRDLSLAAEIQWELLPVLAYAHDTFSIAGCLEPAYDIGGDTFDYAVEPSSLSLGISDARGHGLRAALLGSLATTALRNSRRRGESLIEQVTAANGALMAQFGGEDFVTASLLLVDLPSGATAMVNAGHLPPLMIRNQTCRGLDVHAQAPLGMFAETMYRPQRLDLRPGDRLVLFTDGITEAMPEAGAAFGEARLAELLLETLTTPPAEAVRIVSGEVLRHRAGQLNDDASIVVLDWYGPAGVPGVAG